MSERESSAGKWGSIVVIVLVLAAVVGLVFLSPHQEREDGSALKAGYFGMLPVDWTITDLNGKEIRAGDLRGKVVFLNHWATWCGPCVVEMPGIDALYQSHRGSDIVFILVSKEPAETVRAFAQRTRLSAPVWVASNDFPAVLQSQYIPATFIIDRQGRIVFKEEGGRNWNTRAVHSFLKKVS